MLLTEVVLIALGLGVLLALGFRVLLLQAGPDLRHHYPPAHLLGAAMATAIVVGLLCIRSLNFGVDTVAYAEIFSYYCNGGPLDEYERSFQAATLLLNAAMLGRCDTALIPAAWIFVIVIPLLLLKASWRLRIYLLTAFLLSLIGIELATNALRQGLSVGLMLLAVAFGRRQWLAASACAAIAMLFHSSALLFLGAYLLAHLSWRNFLLSVASLVLLTLSSIDAQVALPLASEFIYEVQKYAAHEGDEIWIRVLAFACVLAALAAPLLSRFPDSQPKLGLALTQGPYAVALRLGMACLPFLALPYFGYRFIYGVYPIILFLTLAPSPLRFAKMDRQFLILCALNVLVLLTWSAGSSYMREVPFLGR